MYLVTGANGFIGSTLVHLLRQKLLSVLAVDSSSLSGDRKYVEYLDIDSPLFYDSLSDYNIEKIFHIGAISSTQETDVDKLLYFNYQHTKFWKQYSVTKGIPLVFLSSASVYGNLTLFLETDTTAPLNLYAISKVLCELILDEGDWIFRPFNVYGLNEAHKVGQSSPIFTFKQASTISLFEGSSNILRDFICVDDVVNILLNYTDRNPGIYNLGTGVLQSFLQVASLYNKPVKEIPFPKELQKKYQYYSRANTDKLRNKLIGELFRFISILEYLNKWPDQSITTA